MQMHCLTLFYKCSCAYVMICELDENRLQAESILAVLVRLIQVHVVAGEQRTAEVRFCCHVSDVVLRK